jgi:hypothetical protein
MKVHNLLVTGSLQSGGENITSISSSVASTVTNVSSSVSASIGQLSSSMALSMTSLSSSMMTSMNNLSSSMVSVMATTGSNIFVGNQTISGSIVPAVNGTYDLGSSTHEFRHLYLSSASLYIDGTKVLGSTTQELQITTDSGQSFKILEAGSDTITLQSADGNITLATSGGGDVILDPTSGIIALKGTTTLYAGNRLLSSDGNAIQIGNSVTMTGSLIVTGFIETQELRTTYISSSILYRSGSTKFGDELGDIHSFTGSLTVSGSISVPGSGLVSGSSQITYSGLSGIPSGIISGSAQLPSGLVSGSAQVDVMSTTNIARLATTGSNTFSGNILVSKAGTTSVELNSTTNTSYSAVLHSESGTPKAYWEYINSAFSDSTRRNYLEAYNSVGGFAVYTAGAKALDISTTGAATFSNQITAGSWFNAPNGFGLAGRNAANTAFRNLVILNSGNQIEIGRDSDISQIRMGTASANDALTIISGGNVGIGTTTPQSKLEVVDGTGSVFRAITSGTNIMEIGNYKAGGAGYQQLDIVSAILTFGTGTAGGGSATERMRITSDGDINIGNYTTNTTLTFQSVNNGSSRINFYDQNNTEGVYIRNTGESYGGTLRIGARWDDDEDKIFFKLYQSSAGAGYDARFGINVDPTDTFHVSSNGITASAPSKGWPVYDAELDTNARRFIFQTAGNGGVSTAGQGASAALILGQYFDSRVIITTPGAGSASPSDQGVGRGRDMMIKAGAADNTVGYSGGRLYLNGGMGYGAGGFNANGGHIIMQSLTGSGNVGINDSNPQTKLSINGANYVEMATFACTTAAASTIVTDNSGYAQFSNGTARHLSNSSVFTATTDGIQILKAGMVYVTVSQDIRTAGTTGYVLLYIQKNKSTISENLITNTNDEWDGINGCTTINVSANDIINFYYSASNITALDPNTWSNYSFVWTSR